MSHAHTSSIIRLGLDWKTRQKIDKLNKDNLKIIYHQRKTKFDKSL